MSLTLMDMSQEDLRALIKDVLIETLGELLEADGELSDELAARLRRYQQEPPALLDAYAVFADLGLDLTER